MLGGSLIVNTGTGMKLPNMPSRLQDGQECQLILMTRISGACKLSIRDTISEHHGVFEGSDGLPTGWTSDLENGS